MTDELLLPPPLAADPTMQAMGEVLRRLNGLDLQQLLVNLVDTVDASALRFLAEQFHVMGDEGWLYTTDETARRQLIKAAIELHRYKGTPWSILRALEVHGYPNCELVEYADYQAQWKAAGGLFMDGSFDMDGRYMAAHLESASAVLQSAALNHWTQYAIRANAADAFWDRQAQRAIIRIAEQFAPVRSHLAALVGMLSWGHYMPSGMGIERIKTRVTFAHCTRLSSVRMRTMDGCWLMDSDKQVPDMSGLLLMDGRQRMAVSYAGPAMDGGQLQLRPKLRVKQRMVSCGNRSCVRSMSATWLEMDGRTRMDRSTMTGAWRMSGAQGMAEACIDHLNSPRMNGLQRMGAEQASQAIAMAMKVTLRVKGQVFQEETA